MLSSKVVVVFILFYYIALKYLLKKHEAKPMLIRWILLLQEFDIEIWDMSEAENMVTNHLSRIQGEEKAILIQGTFPGE